MYIQCSNQSKIPPSQLVNKIGQYLKKKIDGVYKFKKAANEYTLYFTVYYQYTYRTSDFHEGLQYSDLNTMDFEISITTYSNSIRVNVIEISPDEATLGHFVVKEKYLEDWVSSRDIVLNKIRKTISDAFEGYEFVF